MTRSLVIGGTSLMGRPLVESLLARGDAVTILHRGRGTPFGDRVDELRADRNDAHEVRNALAGATFDLVFDNVYDWQRGTTAEQVVATAEAVGDGLRRYVFMSSVAVYPEGGPFHEDDPLVQATPDANPYGVHKAESERALFALSRASGLPVSTLRPAFVYGPHNPFERESFFWDRLRIGRPVIVPEDGSRTMQWVLARDVVGAALRAGDAPVAVGRAFNLAGEPVTQADYLRLLARVAGVEAKLALVPRARIQAAGGDLFGPPLYFGAYLDVPPITVDGADSRELLGLELTPLEEGLRVTWEWYLTQNRPAPDVSWEDELLS